MGAPPSSLRSAFRSEESKQEWVNWVFSRIAQRYDLGNDIMSAGWHSRWKRRLVDWVAPEPGERILDIAAGTGDVTYMLAARGASVVGSDINADMLAVAETKRGNYPPGDAVFELGDAGALPYPDASFDKVTCVYAGRGFPDWPAVLREVHRVLKPGGEFWNLDFARPPSKTFDRVVRGYMTVSGAALGVALHGHPKTYIYIPQSMKNYPGQRWLDAQMQLVGFDTELVETIGCLMAFNHGVKR